MLDNELKKYVISLIHTPVRVIKINILTLYAKDFNYDVEIKYHDEDGLFMTEILTINKNDFNVYLRKSKLEKISKSKL